MYDNILDSDGDNVQERLSNSSKRKTLQYSDKSGSKKKVIINGEEREVLIISSNQTDKKTICSMPNNSLFLGDLIIWNGTHWLVTEMEIDDFVYHKGTIERCNILLKWQNKAGEIIERWGVSTDVASNSEGVVQNSIINLPKLVLGIRLTLDNETSCIRRGKRFLIDIDDDEPNAYITTNRNVITDIYDEDQNHGICSITLSQQQRNNDKDNTELMIADYFVPSEGYESGINCIISYDGNSNIRSGGNYKNYYAKFFNENKDEIEADCQWFVTTLPDHEKYYDISAEHNTLKIKAYDVPEIVGTQIKISVSDSEGLCSNEIFVKVVSLLSG